MLSFTSRFSSVARSASSPTFGYRFMSTLLVVEHDGKKVLSSTLSAATAAQKLGDDVHAIVIGTRCSSAVKAAERIDGVKKVLVADNDAYIANMPENLANLLVKIIKDKSYTNVVVSHSAFGKNFLPRVAALLDVNQISDIIDVKDKNTFVRPIYAGNAIATVKSEDAIKLISVRGSAFSKVGLKNSGAEVENIDAAETFDKSSFVHAELSINDRPELDSAAIVMSGGRGLKNGENFQMLYDLADKVGAAVGASRAAVDAGWVSNDMQIGQTGKIIAPELYISFGVSGAIQHLAGMKDSKTIVAVNKDPEAPIFQVADHGLVDDLFKVIPELSDKVKK